MDGRLWVSRSTNGETSDQATMWTDLRIWLAEKKPTTSNEAGMLADDYVLARQRYRIDPSKTTTDSTRQGTFSEPGPEEML